MNVNPPNWADRFLRWYCNPKYLEEIEGDIYELFDRRIEIKGPRTARAKFVWDVFRFFRWSNVKRSNSKYYSMNHLSLFGNYLKLGMRNIRRNLVSSSINIFGMAIAICFALSMYIFIDMQVNMDSFHKKGDRIYQVTNYVEQEGERNLWSDTPIMLGTALADQHEAIEAATRYEYRSAMIKRNTEVFDELAVFVDPAFLEMFDFPMLAGSKQVLYDKSQIVISKDMAVKYFKDEDPIGKELQFKFLNEKTRRLTIGAVLDEFPYNTSFGANFYLSMSVFDDLDFENTKDWAFMTDGTFVLLKEGEDVSTLQEALEGYVAIQNASDPEWKVRAFETFPLAELSKNGYQIVGAIAGGGHPAGRIALAIIAAFLLGMACFNFMNISVVSASKRLKEIALRKVMGSVRREIIHQFMVENLLKCFFALVVGILLSYFLLTPYFDYMIPEIDIRFRTVDPISIFIFLFGLLAVVGLISGAYPSFYISRFDVITIFKGKEKFGSRNVFSKIMLGVQFFLAIMTIVGCFIMTEQSIYLGDKEWGYDPSGTMSIYVNTDEQYELLKNEVISHPAVTSHTASDMLIGRSVTKVSLEQGDRQMGVRRLRVSANYFETFGLQILDGRALTEQAFDQTSGVVVNQRFVRAMNWDDPVGKTFTYDSIQRTVVGVVADFHYYDFFAPVDPVMIMGLGKNDVHYLTLRAKPDQLETLEAFSQTAWNKIAPNDPFDRVYQEDAFDDFYIENQSNISILMLITGIAIVLASLGLYGLLSFNVQGKLKEFSVRKVLGAEPRTIVRLVGKQYIWVLLISFVIGAPLGSMGMMKLVVDVFPEPKTVTVLPFFVAMLIICFTLVITVAGQVQKAIKVNPAELLRSE